MAEASGDADWTLLKTTKHPPSEADLSAATTCPPTPPAFQDRGEGIYSHTSSSTVSRNRAPHDLVNVDTSMDRDLVPLVERSNDELNSSDSDESSLLRIGDELVLALPVKKDDQYDADDDEPDSSDSDESALLRIGDDLVLAPKEGDHDDGDDDEPNSSDSDESALLRMGDELVLAPPVEEDDHDDGDDDGHRHHNSETVLFNIGDKRHLGVTTLLIQHVGAHQAHGQSTTLHVPPQPKITPPHNPDDIPPPGMSSGVETLTQALVALARSEGGVLDG